MREISATITMGTGSEKHNHDVEYRQTLDHVVGGADDVIELVAHRSYEEQINELMKPYIEEYNRKQDEKFEKAYERFHAGEIKSRPKRRDYKKMSFDYYNEHKNDFMKIPRNGKVEKIPIYRSLILGLGDQHDKKYVSREEACKIFQKTLEKFKKDFPNFHILGATIHADERGFWHMHLDFKPLYEKDAGGRGLNVGTGLDSALKKMGYVPEQSIINGRDKVPLLFNAMRNKLYYSMESAMAEQKIRLQYGVSERKDPGKDSGKNQRLEDWQETQDAARELQHNKNIALDILEKDEVSEEDLTEALQATLNIADKFDEIESSPRSRLDKNKRVIDYKAFAQLRSFVEGLVKKLAVFLHERDAYKALFEKLQDKIKGCIMVDKFEHAKKEKELDDLKRENTNLKNFCRSKGVQEDRLNRIAQEGEKTAPERGEVAK